MLSPPELDLVRRDVSLPGLAMVLDPEAFAGALREGAAVPISSARRTYVRYKPGTSCLVGYELETPGGTVVVSARALAAGTEAKLQKTRAIPAVPGVLGSGRYVFEDRSVIASVFPNDRAIRVLPRLAQPEALRHLLERVFRDQPEFWAATADGLRYKPERRYVAQLRVGHVPVGVLKFYSAETFPAALRASQALAAEGPLRLAPLLGRSRRHHVLGYRWCEGRLLSEVLATKSPDAGEMAVVAAALAALHASEAPGIPHRARDEEAKSLQAVAQGVADILPAVATRVIRVAGKLATRLSREPTTFCTVHGDFYARQVLLADSGALILDLDETARGDGVADLGQFVGHLECDVLGGKLPRRAADAAGEGLLEGYARSTGRKIPARLVAYTAAGLFRLLTAPFREGQPDWHHGIARILDRVEQILSTAETRVRRPAAAIPGESAAARPCVEVSDPLGAINDPAMPFLAAALEPNGVLTRLVASLASRGMVRLGAIRVVRHKPGRRCVVEYELEIEGQRGEAERLTVIGKARAKGPDWAGHRLLETLRDAGFSSSDSAGLCVPEAFGVIPDYHMVLQRKLPGTAASRLLPGPEGPDLARRIAEAIHQLHRADVPATRRHTISDEVRILHERLARLATDQPRLAGRLTRLLAGCGRMADSIQAVVPCGIHRDFYADHVLVDGPRLGLIDFDLYCAGDPALDVGNFMGHLTEHALRHTGDAGSLAEQEAALSDRFAQLSGSAASDRVRVYAFLTLVRHVELSARLPGRALLTDSLLELCEDRLTRFGRTSSRARRRPLQSKLPRRVVEN